MRIEQPIHDKLGRTMIEKGTYLDDYQISYIKNHHIHGIYVTAVVPGKVKQSEKSRQKVKTLRKPDPPKLAISDNTRKELADSIRTIFADTKAEPFDENVSNIVDRLEQAIRKNDAVAIDINQLRVSDTYTYRHSVDVGALVLMIGREFGLKGRELHQLGIAGLLHDIGKSKIPPEILNKPGKLTDEEFGIIKKHSQYGFEILQERGCYSPQILEGVLHHHEKLNGRGYPDGLKDEEIGLFSRIITVADIFDALVSERPYKKPLGGREAVEMLLAMGDEIDGGVVHAFLNSVILYPVDSLVKLSNGEVGRVVENYRGYPMRPKVVGAMSGSVCNLMEDSGKYNVVVSG